MATALFPKSAKIETTLKVPGESLGRALESLKSARGSERTDNIFKMPGDQGFRLVVSGEALIVNDSEVHLKITSLLFPINDDASEDKENFNELFLIFERIGGFFLGVIRDNDDHGNEQGTALSNLGSTVSWGSDTEELLKFDL